jgi:hypothetical protein
VVWSVRVCDISEQNLVPSISMLCNNNMHTLTTWGRLYERWISYPVDKSYPMDKSPIQWTATCRLKMRCTKHG